MELKRLFVKLAWLAAMMAVTGIAPAQSLSQTDTEWDHENLILKWQPPMGRGSIITGSNDLLEWNYQGGPWFGIGQTLSGIVYTAPGVSPNSDDAIIRSLVITPYSNGHSLVSWNIGNEAKRLRITSPNYYNLSLPPFYSYEVTSGNDTRRFFLAQMQRPWSATYGVSVYNASTHSGAEYDPLRDLLLTYSHLQTALNSNPNPPTNSQISPDVTGSGISS